MDNLRKDALDAAIMLAGDVLVDKNLQTDLLSGAPLVRRPKSLDRRVMRMIRHERKKPYREAFVIMKQAAAALLVVCTLAFAMAMSVDAVREALWSAVVEWFDKYIAVMYVTENDPPEVIEEYREPQLVPPGLERVVAKKNRHTYVIWYNNNDQLVLVYTQTVYTDSKQKYDSSVMDLTINNHFGRLFIYDNGGQTLIWNDGKYQYEIFDKQGLEITEILAIAENIF